MASAPIGATSDAGQDSHYPAASNDHGERVRRQRLRARIRALCDQDDSGRVPEMTLEDEELYLPRDQTRARTRNGVRVDDASSVGDGGLSNIQTRSTTSGVTRNPSAAGWAGFMAARELARSQTVQARSTPRQPAARPRATDNRSRDTHEPRIVYTGGYENFGDGTWVPPAGDGRSPAQSTGGGSKTGRKNAPATSTRTDGGSSSSLDLAQAAENASVLLEFFSTTKPANNDEITGDQRDMIATALKTVQEIHTEVRVIDARRKGNRVKAAETEDMKVDAGCIICYSRIADIVFIPCKHLVLCKVCRIAFSGLGVLF